MKEKTPDPRVEDELFLGVSLAPETHESAISVCRRRGRNMEVISVIYGESAEMLYYLLVQLGWKNDARATHVSVDELKKTEASEDQMFRQFIKDAYDGWIDKERGKADG